MKRLRLLLLLPFLLLVGVSPASAHTDLVQASPAPSQDVGGVVDFVDLVFGEPVSGTEVVVTGPSANQLTGSLNTDQGTVLLYTLDEPLVEEGRYQVAYSMTSFDLDFTEREYFFTYDTSSAQPFRFAIDGSVVVEPAGRNWLSLISTVLMVVSVVGVALLVLHRRGVFASSTMLKSEPQTTLIDDEKNVVESNSDEPSKRSSEMDDI